MTGASKDDAAVPARVHLYGQGPRLRALCARLVRLALPGAEVAEFADEDGALAAARPADARTIVLDARVAPEPEAFAAFAAGGGSARAAARGFDRTVRPDVAATVVGAADTRVDVVGDWLIDPQPAARGRSFAGSAEVHSPGFALGGYASAARNAIVGLERAGIDVVWKQFYPETESPDVDAEDRDLLRRLSVARAVPERALVIHPPAHLSGQLFIDRYVEAYVAPPYAIYTMFETETLPARWAPALARAGRVWVPSRFNVETFAAGGVPRELIEYVPLGLEVERMAIDGDPFAFAGRRGCAFLCVCSFSARKGWDILVEAWANAFDRNDDVTLILRTGGVDVRAQIERHLRERGIDPARIAPLVVLSETLSSAALAALYRSVDAFVLPSRGEGVGLPYLEAMALGLPTIGTDWGGATEFLNEETGYLIRSELVQVDRATARANPLLRDQRWAAPSVQATAERMREVYGHREDALLRAARGCAVARIHYNRTRTGQTAAAALDRIAARRSKTGPARATVGYSGELFAIDGAGASARAAVAAFEALAVPVAPLALGADERSALALDDARVLRAGLERSSDGVLASVVHVAPERLIRPPVRGPAIARLASAPSPETLARVAEFDRVWVPSRSGMAAWIGAGLAERNVAIVPEAIDVERWTPQQGGLSNLGPASTLRFLTTSRLDDGGGYDLVIGAFVTAFQPSDDVMLAIKVPGAPLDPAQTQSLVAAAVSRHAPGRAADAGRYRISVLAGIVPEADYQQLVGSFDAFVHVPRVTGWSRALLEAMASALPCICRQSLDLVPCSDETAFPVDGSVESIAGAMRAVAAQPAAAAVRGHAARRAMVAAHSLPSAGRVARALLEELTGTPLGAPWKKEEALADELGIIVDVRRSDRALALVEQTTRTPYRCVPIRGEGPSFRAACEELHACRFIAYLEGEATPTPAWDAVLIDAVRSRPLVAMAVPRVVDAPAPQGIVPPTTPLADFARILSLTQVGRGTQPARVVTSCVLFDGGALLAASASGDGLESLIVRLANGGRAAWCASDAVIGRESGAPWAVVELGRA
jgi:glycosyltransferase involved in cell wall biosynthesis